MRFRRFLFFLAIVALPACAPSGGFLVSDQAQKLGGNLYTERLGDGGLFLVLDGEITRDTSVVFKNLTDRIDARGLVIAQSPGGNVFAAHEVGRQIKKRRMNTVVLTSCASACVDVFVAGQQREMTDVAELGLHAPSVHSWYSWMSNVPLLSELPFLDESEALEATYEIDKRYWAEMGFPKINEKAYRVPNNRIWIISPERARELRLATRILKPSN